MKKEIMHVSVIVLCFLFFFFLADQTVDGWNWGAGGFIFAGIMLFGAGMIYEYIAKKNISFLYRLGVGIAVGTALFMMWANLAVGIIGSEDNPINIIFFFFPVLGLAGSFAVRFSPNGLAYLLFCIAGIHIVIAFILYVLGTGNAFGVNIFFAFLWSISGFLFLNEHIKKNRK